MTSQTSERFIHVLQQTEATGDVEPLVALFSQEAELSNLALKEPLHGQENIRRFWLNYLSVFEHIQSRFTNVIEDNSTAVLEWVSEGTLASGEPLNYRGISVLEIEEGQVRRFRTYYDSAVFLPQGSKLS